MNVAILCKYGPVSEALLRYLKDHETRLVNDKPALVQSVPDADVLVMSNGGFPFRFVDGDVFASAPRLRLVQLFGVMWDALDLGVATERGIPVANVPGANSLGVAEIALFLVFALAKRARSIEQAWREQRLGRPEGVQLCGKTLCIVGFGHIGCAVAIRARAMGMNVVVVNRTPNWAMARAVGALEAYGVDDLEAALRQSQVVLLAVPLNDATIGLIDSRMLAAMPKGSFLVNVARGPVVDREALWTALEAGHLGGYGADVWWEEPAHPSDPLLQRDDVFFTPHIGGATREALESAACAVRENIERVARGLPPHNVVNGRGTPGH